MKKQLLFVLILFIATSAYAQERDNEYLQRQIDSLRARIDMMDKAVTETSDKEKKEKKHKLDYRFGGNVDARFIYNSYESKSPRDGVLFFYPLKPEYNTHGEDLNRSGSMNFSPFSTRLWFGVDNIKAGKATLSAYIETDFLGSSDALNHTLRLRHAYMDIAWGNNLFRIGQTNHMTVVEDVLPATVTFNAGVPFQTLNRGPQIRYARRFSDNVKLLAAAEYYTSHRSAGPTNAQIKATMPDIHFRMEFGKKEKIMGGFGAGYKFFKPLEEDMYGYKTKRRAAAFDVNAFLRFAVKDYTFKAWSLFGQNLTPYNIIGGYAPMTNYEAGELKYANLLSSSSWIDISTPTFGKFDFGLFAGFQANLGANKPLDTENGYFNSPDLKWFSRISPRVYFNLGKHLRFGFEYSYTNAKWMQQYDNMFESISCFDVNTTHRTEILAQFRF